MGRSRVSFHRCMEVSILVFVELALDGGFSLLQGHSGNVSILVFVELALDERLFFVLFPV